jgi:hypothetical protein
MRYSRLQWNHASPSEPIEILSEYDENGWERRKVEVFQDGSVRFASGRESVGGSELSLIPCPPDAEVVNEPEFRVFEMTKEEFEQAWARAYKVNGGVWTEAV